MRRGWELLRERINDLPILALVTLDAGLRDPLVFSSLLQPPKILEVTKVLGDALILRITS